MKNLKHLFPLILVVAIIYAITAIGCKKESPIAYIPNDGTTAKGSFQPYNCSTDTTQAASIQLLSPLTPKSWFNLGHCFTAPVQTIPTPIIYTNGDSMPVTLRIFVNQVFTGNGNKFVDEKIDEFFYYPCFHGYPTPYTRFPQKPALQNGTFTFPITFKFEKKGLYNGFINYPWAYNYDTVAFNYDAYDFGMHSATTNGYAYVRVIIKSDKK